MESSGFYPTHFYLLCIHEVWALTSWKDELEE